MVSVSAQMAQKAQMDSTLPKPWSEMTEEERLDFWALSYSRYERPVFRHAYYLLGHRDDADDVKQETFLKAYRAMPSFRNDCSLQTWLLKICGNLCRDRIKARQRHREVLYDPHTTQDCLHADTDIVDPYAIVDRAETGAMILRVLNGLPMQHRNIIVLHEIEGMSCKEIAEILDCSQASVKLRLFRARRQFKERVQSFLRVKD
ncbi:MAG TPA: RNA polymerase sigma factor [Chthonomonadaceae bacterium]|nr:RNA polymerase sigma factor [Chthonomonadaceae bacterium]